MKMRRPAYDAVEDDLRRSRSHALDFGLFGVASATAAARASDPATSHAAAEVATTQPRLSRLQAQVLDAIRAHPGITDAELEALPVFQRYGPSTVRKRRTDLLQMGMIEAIGTATRARSVLLRWRARDTPREVADGR